MDDPKFDPIPANEIKSDGERVMLSIFAAMGLLAMGCAIGLMGIGMHYLPGAYGAW